MDVAEPSFPRREALWECWLRSTRLALAGGAAIGALESLKVLATSQVRYTEWAAKLVAIGIGGYALLAIALSIPCALLALALSGRPRHRATLPSTCAGLGAILALVAFLLISAVNLETLLPTALAATLACLALRELLAWWPMIGRAKTWAAAFVVLALADAVAVAIEAPAIASKAGTKDATNVLLVTIDTLRADHVGCYGDATAATPTIDALAREGVLFEDATSQANTTGPSHTTILTGLYPAEHGALANGRPISGRVHTLADVLGKTRATGAFVSGFTLVDEACGLAERFDRYEDDMLAWRWMPRVCERLRLVSSAIRFVERHGVEVKRADRPAEETVGLALDWLSRPRDEPFFCWLHLYDPHAPYQPPERFARMHGIDGEPEPNWYALATEGREGLIADANAVERMKAQYAAEISYADEQVGRVLAALRASGALERTLVVLTSDHGEGMGSHGYWFDHGTFLYDEELHVPLVMRFPHAEHAGLRVKNQVRLLDIAPTVLDYLGASNALKTTGASLMPLVDGAGESIERPSFALAWMDGSVSGFAIDGQRHSLRLHGRKVIWSSSHWLDTQRVPERIELYDLAPDRDEQRDLASDPVRITKEELLPRLIKWRDATASAAEHGELDADLLEQLRKLGYL